MDAKKGTRISSAVVTIAAGATAENLFLQSTSGTNNKPFIVRKIRAYNNVGATTLQIGTGLAGAWARILPTFRLVNNMDNVWTEAEIPEIPVNANLTVQTDVLGVQVQVEVEEI